MTLADHPLKIGPYRIEECLGKGGMGTVYRAYDERLRRHVALKQIHPERSQRPGVRDRFLREAQAAARLNHPALVHVHDILETGDGAWIVMELVEGIPLDRLLKSGRLTLQPILMAARGIAEGLTGAHAEGILHRDLKAENVVITGDGQPKVLDFGLAKTLDVDGDSASVTADGHLVGTPRAMSPEQARGRPLDHRTDLFSLGTLLYEMVTGRSPFLGPGPAETLARVCHHEQDPAHELNPETPRELSDLIDRLLAKEPSERPSSAAEVAEELKRITDAEGNEELPEARPSLPEPQAVPSEDLGATSTDSTQPFQFRGERRQLTLFCCELTGVSLDPEVLFEVLPPFQAVVHEAIERYDGHLRDTQGHRLVACFGYPRSHEDNAWRAVMTALQIVTRTRLVARGFEARASVHTGSAVVLNRETGEQLVLGDTLDLATSLQEQAEPGSVLVSSSTRRLVLGAFEEEVEISQNGGGEAFRLTVTHQTATHQTATHQTATHQTATRQETDENLAPFVGRDGELALLTERFELAREGVGQVVLISGDVGVGKSRLLRELRDRLSQAGPRWTSSHGSVHVRNLPLYPIRDFLRQLLAIDENDDDDEQLAQLEKSLFEHDFPAEETIPLFASLLGLPADELDLSCLRRKTLETVPALLQEVADRQPSVVIFEDLQLVDPTTLELIGHLVDKAATTAMLLVLTCRPQFRPPWEHRARMTQLQLTALEGNEIDELIDSLANGMQLSTEARRRVAADADGIPLFALELLRASTDEAETIPATLNDVMTVRLDRQGTARDVARIASVLGREIRHQDLATIAALGEDLLAHEIDRLLDANVLVEKDGAEPPVYVFQHALVRQAARASLLTEDLERLQRRLAKLRG